MKKNQMKTIGVLGTVALLTGCATIMGQSAPETLNVRSAPDQANVSISDETGTKIFEGKTPTALPLEKKKGYFSGKKYSVVIRKDGYADHTISVDTKVNGWYIGGNLLFGALIGWLIVDPATGAMWKLDTNEINVTLNENKPEQEGAKSEPSARIMLLDDVPLSLRSKMVRISQ